MKICTCTFQLIYWCLNRLLECGQQMPRLILFCRSINDVGSLHVELCCYLPRSLHRFISMYHSSTSDDVKKYIQSDMCSESGTIRVLICTSAAGMGLNFSLVTYVVHYGPPHNVDTFVQQLGRAGRDGSQSYYLLLYCGRQKKGVDNEMLCYLNAVDCRRKQLMSFHGGSEQSVVKHLCCDNCSSKCVCNDVGCLLHKTFPLFNVHGDNNDVDDMFSSLCFENSVQYRCVSQTQKLDVQLQLLSLCSDYDCISNSNCDDAYVKNVASNLTRIFSLEDLWDVSNPCCDDMELHTLRIIGETFSDL
jgi:superfamily II DNA helicase RecQ